LSAHAPLPKLEEVQKGKYKHYKGGLYEVIGTARHSETLEELVVYLMLENNSLWVRPKTMFLGEIEHNGKKMKRFEFLG